MSIETAREEIKEEKQTALKEITDELANQRRSFENHIEQQKKEFAEEIKVTKETLNQSTKFVEIMTEKQWSDKREEYEEINDELKKWELNNNLNRGEKEASSINELLTYLNDLKIDGNKIAESIKLLYLKRHRLYESLKRFSQIDKTLVARLSNVDFTLPSPPKLPRARSTASGSFSMGN